MVALKGKGMEGFNQIWGIKSAQKMEVLMIIKLSEMINHSSNLI